MTRVALILVVLSFAGCEPSSPSAAFETKAIGSLRAIHQAENRYRSTYGRYAAWVELGPLLDKDLASGTKGSYRFVLTATTTGYTVNADPLTFGSSGRRTFFSDQSMAVHQNFGPEPAGPSNPTLQ